MSQGNEGSGKNTIGEIISKVESGDGFAESIDSLGEFLSYQEHVTGYSIYLPEFYNTNARRRIRTSGNAPGFPVDYLSTYTPVENTFGTYFWEPSNKGIYFFPTIYLGVTLGGIIVQSSAPLNDDVLEQLVIGAHMGGMLFEQQRLSKTLQHFIDRLQILNDLNQLIAANVGVEGVIKSVVRESAYRFAADVVFAYVVNPERNLLELKGGYGCSKEMIPDILDPHERLAGQVLRSGSHVSVRDMKSLSVTDFSFLSHMGVTSLDACGLEVKNEGLGLIILGYKRHVEISREDITRFEELCGGAAVAICNARNQDRIKAYTEGLEELVEQRTADLAVQTEKAQDANKAKSKFLANMSHELRTPLTAIVGYSSILSDGLFGDLNEKQIDGLTAISRSSEHLKTLIDDILNLARIESGKEEPEPTSVPLDELLKQTIKLMAQAAQQKKIKLTAPECPSTIEEKVLFADQKHVHQIIINLLSNAIKYTPDGGKVWIEIDDAGDKVKISVCDTGVGVEPAQLHKLFERFERGDNSYSTQQEGTGIGLNLTKRLVTLNGGHIGVESTVGEGSRFWVMMPTVSVSKTKERILESQGEKELARLEGLSALIIDDNLETRELLTLILESSGASVKAYHGVDPALEFLSSTMPDVIITDLAMPGKNGIELIKSVRANKKIPDELPIIVLSACAFEDDKNAVTRAGASFFLAKPFRPSEVLTTVRNMTISAAMKRKRSRKKPIN